ncbi:MAG: DegT/DnrJ/EryC1/StrS family aminotransferase [Muribaculaceae bacterium]|nr:DegT/DnrJ/EryC1/StrS family aminotransferase [Muribaculaceae bacterium]
MNKTSYPFLDLGTVNRPYAAAIEEAAMRVIASGRYVGGPECDAFERELAAATGTDFCVGVSNGLDAIKLIFKAYIAMGRLHKGDAVLVPANTYIASVLAITDAGLVPVFAESHPRTMNLDTARLEEFYTPAVKAILTVHLYGRPAYDAALRDFAESRGLLVVEDNAQAIGADAPVPGINGSTRTGSLGHAAAFSFYPTKNIGALGDAGAVTTSDAELASTVRALANYGSDRRYHNIYEGYNCRLDPIQAAVLRAKLPHLDAECARRRALAAVYEREIKHPDIIKPVVDSPDRSVWHQYVIQVPGRDSFRAWLESQGVGTDIHYAVPPHLQPCYSRYAGTPLPVTCMLADTVLSLPVSACTSEADAEAIADIINRYRK